MYRKTAQIEDSGDIRDEEGAWALEVGGKEGLWLCLPCSAALFIASVSFRRREKALSKYNSTISFVSFEW